MSKNAPNLHTSNKFNLQTKHFSETNKTKHSIKPFTQTSFEKNNLTVFNKSFFDISNELSRGLKINNMFGNLEKKAFNSTKLFNKQSPYKTKTNQNELPMIRFKTKNGYLRFPAEEQKYIFKKN